MEVDAMLDGLTDEEVLTASAEFSRQLDPLLLAAYERSLRPVVEAPNG